MGLLVAAVRAHNLLAISGSRDVDRVDRIIKLLDFHEDVRNSAKRFLA